MKTVVWAVVIALVTAAGAAYWYWDKQGAAKQTAAAAAGPRQMPPMPVEAQTARIGAVAETLEAVGSLRSDESVVIKAETAGRVGSIHFTEGMRIEQGALLISLDDSIQAAQLEQAKASLALSRANHERAQELLRSAAASTKARDEALAKLRIDEANLALAQAVLGKMRIYAPQTGLLGLRQVSVGDYLAVGQVVVNIERIDPIKVDFRVPEVFAPAVRRGQAIAVTVDALPGREFTGEVIAADPRIDVNGRNMTVRAVLSNREGLLLPGMFARVRLELRKRENAVLVPEEAIMPGRPPTIFKVVDGKAVRTPVVTGERQGAMVELREGVAAGDVVVTAGQMKIGDGAPVAIVQPKG